MKLPNELPPQSQALDTQLYPYWKVVGWRFLRGSMWGGIANLATVTFFLTPDLANYREYATAIATAFMAGVGNAAFLVIRDTFSEGDKSAPVQKLPL